MGAKRVKKQVYVGVTREQADAAFGEFAAADAREQKLTATMDEQITKVRDKYSDDLKDCSEKKERSFEIIQSYATENKDSLFAKKKSVETVHGVFGFRSGTPKLKTRKGFTWQAVTELLKLHLPAYVRKVEEPAKDLLLTARDDEKVNKFFPEVGVWVDREETFFIECKKEVPA